jgi:hypothetical protein
MTLGMAWVRSIGGIRELIVISDSRLSGGQFWDANPKIMLLPRSDCVISFAGNTNAAYPLMLQAYNAIIMFEAASNRRLDVPHLKGHLVRVFNRAISFVSHLPVGQQTPDAPDAIFMLAGYSWREKRFRIWKLYFDENIKRFTFRPTMPWKGEGQEEKLITFVGDGDLVTEARKWLPNYLRKSGRLESGGLNMEPFEVLRDMIRSGQFPNIGGAPQLVKIYEHMNAVPAGIFWPDKASDTVSVLGRPLMKYEKVRWRVIDPDDVQ